MKVCLLILVKSLFVSEKQTIYRMTVQQMKESRWFSYTLKMTERRRGRGNWSLDVK